MSPLEFSLVFVFGLVSSLHCLQMCGPIVLSWSVGRNALRANLKYNSGRILTYTLLGALAGFIGKGIGSAAQIAGFSAGARIVAGAAMILAGILMIGLFPSSGLVQLKPPARFTRWIGHHLRNPGIRIGLMLGFLPCGLIYAALLKAIDSGGPWAGALTMLAFGLGTSVSLLLLGTATSLFHFRWSTKFAAVCVMLTGAVLLYRGLTAPRCHVAQALWPDSQVVSQAGRAPLL